METQKHLGGIQIRDNLEFLIDPPACSVYHSSAVSVSSGSSFTTLNADSEDFDNDSMHSTSTNTSRITIQTAGRYHLKASVLFDGLSSPGGARGLQFYVNGSTQTGGSTVQAAQTANIDTVLGIARDLVLAAGDYVEVRCRHFQGSAIDVRLESFEATFFTR